MATSSTAKIYILYENSEWLAPLAKELSKRNLPFEAWNLAQGSFNINKEPPHGVFFNKMSASSYTRGNLHAKDLTAPVLAWLEAYGRRVINKRRALQLEISKAEQQIALTKAGFYTPITKIALGKAAVIEAAKSFGGSPFIIKPNQGGKGLGVSLFNTIQELEQYLEMADLSSLTVDGILLVQQYIPPANQQIIRMEFVNGRFLYAVRVNTGGGFELCPADACEIDPAAPNKQIPSFEILNDFYIPEIEMCESFLKDNGIEIAGMEFLEDAHGKRYFYDVNTNTNYNTEAENKSGLKLKGMELVVDFLAKELEMVAAAIF